MGILFQVLSVGTRTGGQGDASSVDHQLKQIGWPQFRLHKVSFENQCHFYFEFSIYYPFNVQVLNLRADLGDSMIVEAMLHNTIIEKPQS